MVDLHVRRAAVACGIGPGRAARMAGCLGVRTSRRRDSAAGRRACRRDAGRAAAGRANRAPARGAVASGCVGIAWAGAGRRRQARSLRGDRGVAAWLDHLATGRAGPPRGRGLDGGLPNVGRARPSGWPGRHQEPQGPVSEAGVPPWRRPSWPLLQDATAIVAVPGLAVAEGRAVEQGWWPDWRPR